MKKDVFLAHNTSADKIIFSDKIGGFVCPSLAVIDSDSGFHTFGDITLIKNINDYDFKANPAFDCDIYSARYPSIFYNFNYSKIDSVIKKFDEILKKIKVVDHNGKEVSGLKVRVSGDLYEMRNVEHYKYDINQFKLLAINSLDIRILHAISMGVEPILVLRPEFNGVLKPVGVKTIMNIVDEMNGAPIDDECLDIVCKHIYPIVKKSLEAENNRLLSIIKNRETDSPEKIAELIELNKSEFEKVFCDGKFVGGPRVKNNIFSAISNVKLGNVSFYDGKTIEYLDKKLKINSLEPNKTKEQSDKFYEFAAEMVEDFYKDSYFFNKNRRAVKLSAENMLKELSFGLKNQETDCINSAIQIKAELAKPMRNILQITKNINKITTRKNYKSGLDDVNKMFDEYVSGLRDLQKNKLSFFDSEYLISEFTKEFIYGRKDLSREFRDDFDMGSDKFSSVVDKLRAIISTVADLQVNYFEVKHKGIIGLSDFSAAIVPKGVDKAVVDKLIGAGLSVVEYEDKKIDTNIKVDKNWVSAIKKVKELGFAVNVSKNNVAVLSMEV